jgi:hypothetical protein
MSKSEEGLERLRKEFSEAGIPTDSPGFYEHRAFVRREQKEPAYLDNYARFVQWQSYSPAYLEKAEQIVHVVIAELQLALKLDANQKAFDETPLVISRILEREGIWNYLVGGTLTITFPSGSGFEPVSFWSVDMHKGARRESGHRWVFAPPFQVIDLTILSQDCQLSCMHLLPKLVMEMRGETEAVGLAEVLSPAAIEEIRRAGQSLEEGIDRFIPGYRERFAPDFPAALAGNGGARLKYIPTAAAVSEADLEQLQGFRSNGRTASQIYDREIKPRLAEI